MILSKPSSWGSGPTKSMVMLLKHLSGTHEGCKGPTGLWVGNLLHWQAVHDKMYALSLFAFVASSRSPLKHCMTSQTQNVWVSHGQVRKGSPVCHYAMVWSNGPQDTSAHQPFRNAASCQLVHVGNKASHALVVSGVRTLVNSANCRRKTLIYRTNPRNAHTSFADHGNFQLRIFSTFPALASIPWADMWCPRKLTSIRNNNVFFGEHSSLAHLKASIIILIFILCSLIVLGQIIILLICLGCNKDLWSQRSKYKSYGALRWCDLGVRDCLQVYCGK